MGAVSAPLSRWARQRRPGLGRRSLPGKVSRGAQGGPGAHSCQAGTALWGQGGLAQEGRSQTVKTAPTCSYQQELHSRPRESDFSKSCPLVRRVGTALQGPRAGSTDLQAGHAAERGRRVSEVDPLGQQIATVGEVQKTLPLLAPDVLTARIRHVPPDTRAAPGSAIRL